MSKVEKLIKQKGGRLVRNNKHKIYEVQGQTFIISNSDYKNTYSAAYKPMINKLNKMADA